MILRVGGTIVHDRARSWLHDRARSCVHDPKILSRDDCTIVHAHFYRIFTCTIIRARSCIFPRRQTRIVQSGSRTIMHDRATESHGRARSSNQDRARSCTIVPPTPRIMHDRATRIVHDRATRIVHDPARPCKRPLPTDVTALYRKSYDPRSKILLRTLELWNSLWLRF